MTITNARWADAAQSAVLATLDGVEVTIPADLANRDYARIIAEGVPVQDFPVPTLAELKAEKATQVRALGASKLDALTAKYTPSERDTWAQQAREADAWTTSGDAADAPMLSRMAARRGFTLQQMVEKVNGARQAFTLLGGDILGAQQALEDAIEAADDKASLDAIDPNASENWPA